MENLENSMCAVLEVLKNVHFIREYYKSISTKLIVKEKYVCYIIQL